MGGRGQSAPRDFWQGNFCWPTGKKRQRKKGKRGENWEEKKENFKREKRGGVKLKMEGKKVTKSGEDLCVCICVCVFCFVLFFAFYFPKPLKFVLGLPKWKFSTGKKHFTPGKKSGKWLCPLRKFCLLRPCMRYLITTIVTSCTQVILIFVFLLGHLGHLGRFLLLFFTGFLFLGLYFALFFSTKSFISLSFFLKTLWSFSQTPRACNVVKQKMKVFNFKS